MSIIGITVVRNEEDIIESMLRHNLHFIDAMMVIDNESADHTPVIVKQLADEGLPVTLGAHEAIDHPQASIITTILKILSSRSGVTHAILLDADEFIVGSPEKLRLQLRSDPDVCWSLPWMTYVPTKDDDWNEADPLRRIQHRRTYEPASYSKVIVPQHLFATAVVSEGNHGLQVNGLDIPTHTMPGIRLAHFPLRNVFQLTSKALLGEWSLSLKPSRQPTEGFQWRLLAERLMSGTPASSEDLCHLASTYAAPNAVPLVKDGIEPFSDHKSAYTKIRDTRLTNLIAFTNQLVSRLGSLQKSAACSSIETDQLSITQARHGLFAFVKNDTVIGRSMNLYGEWGEHEIALISALLSEGDVVLDIGANIGTHAVPLARHVGPVGRVHAFEPQRLIFNVLCGNIALNDLENVVTHCAAVGAECGSIAVPSIPLAVRRNVGHTALEQQSQGEKVSLITIDSLELSRVNLLKVDVEGMELDVLRGASETIARCRPILYLENNIEARSFDLLSYLEVLGYQCWWHLAPYFNDKNYKGVPLNIFHDVGRPEINLLCLPSVVMPVSLMSKNLIPVAHPTDTWRDALARVA